MADETPGGAPPRPRDSADGEQARFKEVLEHKPHKLDLNEGGRTTESDERGNPPGAVHGLPQPAIRETGR